MKIKVIIVLIFIFVNAISAQTTEFTYQGILLDNTLPPTASYDFRFGLFRGDVGGDEIASQTITGVTVTNGIFTVILDFGSQFPGASRWLEIAVRPAGTQIPFTTLSPRQSNLTTPYSIRSTSALTADTAISATTATNALELGSVAANQFVITTDPRLTNARNPLPGSDNYIQNFQETGAVQNADFNISGNGTTGRTLSGTTVNSTTQYNIGNNRVLSIPGIANTFVGLYAGTASTGNSNSFFGYSAGGGPANSGNANSFFGDRAGASNTIGTGNSFVGSAAGVNNTTGTANSFFGLSSGGSNTIGVDNSFFGAQSGISNTTGFANSFFGRSAGGSNTTGEYNSFFGRSAGASNTAGDKNSFFGYDAGSFNAIGNSNSFFGHSAGKYTSSSSNSFFGYSSGASTTTGDLNSFFGSYTGMLNTTGGWNSFFGTNVGLSNRTGGSNSFFGNYAGDSNTTGSSNSFFGIAAGAGNFTGSSNTIIGSNADVGSWNLTFATAIGANAVVSTSNTVVLGRSVDKVSVPGNLSASGTFAFSTLGTAGGDHVCRNSLKQLAACGSSLRYKTNITPYLPGIALVKQLRPITFDWKEGGNHDIGFGAEDVFQIEPLLTTRNDKGEIEGVKYAQISTVLVNAVNEQQALIESLQNENKTLQESLKQLESEFRAMKTLVCSQKPAADLCGPKNKEF